MKDQKRAKTKGQVRAIYAEASSRGIDSDMLHEMVADVTRRTRSIAALTFVEAQKLIQRIKGNSFVPLRTLQHRRQQAGIPQLVTREQLNLIAELASQRNWGVDALTKFNRRQCKREAPRTTSDANKIIEGLKEMNKREGLWAGE